MFEILPTPSLELVMSVARAALLLGAFWVFAMAFRRWRQADLHNIERLHTQLQRAFEELRGMHETITVLRGRVDLLLEQSDQEQRRLPTSGTSGRGYEVAARLARNGLDVNELIANCGINRNEAELLARLNVSRSREPEVNRDPRNSTALSRDEQTLEAALNKAPAARKKRGSILSVVG